MTNIIAIDPGKTTGLCWYNADVVDGIRLNVCHFDRWTRFQELIQLGIPWLEVCTGEIVYEPIDVVIIEEPLSAEVRHSDPIGHQVFGAAFAYAENSGKQVVIQRAHVPWHIEQRYPDEYKTLGGIIHERDAWCHMASWLLKNKPLTIEEIVKGTTWP